MGSRGGHKMTRCFKARPAPMMVFTKEIVHEPLPSQGDDAAQRMLRGRAFATRVD